MSEAPFIRGALRLAAAVLLAAIPASPSDRGDPAAAADPAAAGPVFNVRIAEPATARAVRRALEGAFERLADERCAAVLEDFTDASGEPLTRAAERLGATSQEVLGLLFFYDGSTKESCRPRNVQATTEVGSRVVLVCGLRFFETYTRKPFRAEAYLIHEMLHTLGLGENPPSGRAITRRVVKRCKDAL
jgi:hypothetical protein